MFYPLTDYNRALQNHHVSETHSSINTEVTEMDEDLIYTYIHFQHSRFITHPPPFYMRMET
jgi:hypothetical protein